VTSRSPSAISSGATFELETFETHTRTSNFRIAENIVIIAADITAIFKIVPPDIAVISPAERHVRVEGSQ
jgi:hypothetical protein